MGTCLGTPVSNHHSSSTAINSEASGSISKQRRSYSDAAGKAAAVGGYESESMRNEETDPPPAGNPKLKMFTLDELKTATRNFRPDTILGEGGFGSVFRGWIDEETYAPTKVGVGMEVAVKQSDTDSAQGLEEWQSEVKFLGKFSHPNLVKLLGYCWEEKQLLLVYECMQKGSLEKHLFRKGAEPLAWDIRLKIAIGAATGLAFLHSSEKSVIYRDFKTSNILLDGDYNAKLSDFGLAKFGPINGDSHVTTRVMGTYGYTTPEYIATGHLYVKSDVYGFGAVLLELLTGLRVYDSNRPCGEDNLRNWARPYLRSKEKIKQIMDPNLEDQYSIEGVMQAAGIIIKCLDHDPKKRPSMDQVLETLQKIKELPKDTKTKKHKDHHHSASHGDGHGARARAHPPTARSA